MNLGPVGPFTGERDELGYAFIEILPTPTGVVHLHLPPSGVWPRLPDLPTNPIFADEKDLDERIRALENFKLV